MNIRCLFKGHDWEFSYNHGVPLGTSLDDTLKMFEEGTTFPVDVCARPGCGKQSYLVNGVRKTLRHGEIEEP